ncbi:MAG: hypothetical protein D3903_22240, partial [Candidatus Electrothrix sp. GM3_4]|nr:hypothetical protein [Candidatus Electrothrix sp. GM3_4]
MQSINERKNIPQPAFLTNYQQYYCGLRQGLHTEALAMKLRRTLTELDILLALLPTLDLRSFSSVSK